jgi:uncharacterized protein (TIGR03083 family)
MATTDLMPLIVTHRRAFAGVLEGLVEADWNAPSLCSGWRVRDVVAHMTMPFRYSTPRFLGELIRSRGKFPAMADRVARRDARAPIVTLLQDWRSNVDHPWKPPGGGHRGALTHDVVHGLDITIALTIEHPVSDPALRVVLQNATTPLSLRRSGVDLTEIQLVADDLEWCFGEGEPLRGRARDLLMVLMNHQLPAGLLSGGAVERFARD